MTLSTQDVRLEDGQTVVVLLLSSIGLAELALEESEVVLGVQQMIGVSLFLRHNLTDQRIGVTGGDGGDSGHGAG
uniref:hypothetical protein n=1 Tax=Bacillus paralicheniformis TaxID=1648923 RepID=UPI001F10A2A3|nr:hypothetical protein [Bacillus paralicheniformis]